MSACWNYCHSLLRSCKGFCIISRNPTPISISIAPSPHTHFSAGKRSSKVLCKAGCDHRELSAGGAGLGVLRGHANKHSFVCHNLVPRPGLALTARLPLPSLACLPPVTLIGWSPFLRETLSAPVWVECLESPRLTKSRWFVLKLLLCPQGEQGEDGKAEGPPGPPGDRVSAPPPSNFHPQDQGQGGPRPPAVWGGRRLSRGEAAWSSEEGVANEAQVRHPLHLVAHFCCCPCHSGPCG